MHKNVLAKSVRLALISGAAAAAFASPAVFAADEDGAKVERIEVTGSRIKRSDLEGASPITTITTEDMKMEGNFTVADALRNSNLNSFGSFSERSGSSAQSQATIDLRGAGSSRTLVLIDGKRFPGSPTLGGASANLNAIPMAAVERIDILTDGASSTYGSDAIAGVVNIIMKKNYQGIEFNVGGGSRDQDGGLTSKEFSVVAGYQMDKGNITFSFDHQDRKGISDADRPYTAASMTDFNGDGEIQAYEETSGWSIYGATVAAPDFSTAQASLLCNDLEAQYGSDVFQTVKADNDWGGAGSTYCMYAFANVSYNKASTERNTVYVDANYEIAEDIEWFGRVMVTAGNSFGRYAPPAAAWNSMAADNPHNPYGEETTGYFRWVGIGTRDGNVDDYNQDYLTGLRGTISALNDAEWEFYYHHNIADNKSIGEYYLSYAGLAYNQANDIDLGSEAGINNMKTTTLTQGRATFDQYSAGIGFDAFELPGGAVAHYVGMEYFDQQYSEVYDAQSEAGLVGGSAGNSAGGDRQVWAMFYEAVLPLTDDIELNLAARYDDYSDFGDNVAPKASVRWQALDNVVVRASYSEAFRAPSLDQLYAATTFSADTGTDYPFCESAGISDADCSSKQYDTYIRANDSLGPETSKYTNLGVAWDIVDDIGVKVDYFNLKIDDVISRRTITNVMRGIGAGTLAENDTFYVKRAPNGVDGSLGRALEVGTGYGNGDKLEITGIDVALNAKFETAIGDIGFNWNNSFVLDYIQEVEGGSEAVDIAGWNGSPDYKSNFTTNYSMGDHRFSWNMSYTASTYEDDDTGHLDSWLIHNISYVYDAGNYGSLLLGVNNLTDEDPVLSSVGIYENPDLYNNYGREYRASYTLKF
ncbi:TonB-dependent receptor [Shewanella sp. SR43-4]|jgi:iron complex outermembrane receptor protein|uniref:TonB-dependent receptor domain-containing protein n=1 Tax=Shewanella TaxID=22 RepID=UPI000CBB26A7|nr:MULTISPECIES: TonB-dependent receptor [Shewanella]NCQ44037.1 TonB-dependent receptor [Shewanella frigidimarina]MBB1316708.1 TonB-dependent receptor [Shewanella sp. SR43-4]MBB1320469.1 TonB-dependent receptor [Shewanella sp. SR43-8]MBB1474558.1 TonB-dependent receptor [Shewanella sp. SG41-3]NCO70411.1 TonB-dependent receptor [Shewanella vesiculosa]|tara:strand:- start:952 stop:3564 length:2613 start_codon:yes stop_codon:yes gene_type:complete